MSFRDLQDMVNEAVVSSFKESTSFTYTQSGHDPVTVDAVLSQESEVVEMGGMAQVIASKTPSLLVRASDLEDITPGKGDAVALGAQSYTVAEVHPDGYGCYKLILRLA